MSHPNSQYQFHIVQRETVKPEDITFSPKHRGLITVGENRVCVCEYVFRDTFGNLSAHYRELTPEELSKFGEIYSLNVN